MCRVLIADDHPLMRDALRSALACAFEVEATFDASTLDEVLEALRANGDLDLVLLDLNMPGMKGFSGLLSIRAEFPATPVAMVSATDDRRVVQEAIACGAAGFIPKSTPRDAIAEALRFIMDGGVYVPPAGEGPETEEDAEEADIARRLATLTAQQLRVLELLGTGRLNKEIAFELNIAETTVKAHVSAILQKLKVYSRTQAVIIAGRIDRDKLARIRARPDGPAPEKAPEN
ncbi:MAG TPA: response regulator transcription factor [Azospirillaceae bacterium]|nr:response regulator transcription factor [Azospirillaceae bacterium]